LLVRNFQWGSGRDLRCVVTSGKRLYEGQYKTQRPGKSSSGSQKRVDYHQAGTTNSIERGSSLAEKHLTKVYAVIKTYLPVQHCSKPSKIKFTREVPPTSSRAKDKRTI
jgi:hypothetical protein